MKARAAVKRSISGVTMTSSGDMYLPTLPPALRGLEKWATEINKERAARLTKTPDHERPSAIDEIQKVAASHSREQLSQIFRKN